MSKPLRVYIAGPMTNGGQGYNMKRIHEAIEAYLILIEKGFVPHCPQLTVFCDLLFPNRLSHNEWLSLDEKYINNSDVVLRLSGDSAGADHECEYARSKGIPIVHGLDTFFDFLEEIPA